MMSASQQTETTGAPLTKRRRLAQIASVLSRYGLGYLIGRFGLSRLIPGSRPRLLDNEDDDQITNPQALRMALEELGTTAIKFGQVLSTRPDLLPPPYLEELAKLRDSVPPVPVAEIRAIIEAELGKPVAELFAEFNDVPLGAASIGQAHVAQLHSGEEVVIKVQKPGVATQVDIDLQLLDELAKMAQQQSKMARDYDIVAIIQEFGWSLRGELDYEREGRNADTFRKQFENHPEIVVPTIHWQYSTKRVLTMQRIIGVNINDIEGIERLGINRHDLAIRGANMLMIEMLDYGFYHADPHPGNLLVLDNGAIGVLDFGMVGRISDRLKLDLIDLLNAVISQDADDMVDALEALGIAGAGANRAALSRDLGHLLDRYMGRTLEQLNISDISNDLFAVIRRHHLQMPSDLVMLLKVLGMYEGTGRLLDPGFNVMAVAEPYVKKSMTRQLQFSAWEPKLRRGVTDAIRIGSDLPAQLRRFNRRLDQGDLTITVQHQELEQSMQRLEAMVNRIALSVLFSAFLVGLGLIIVAYQPDEHARFIRWLVGAGFAMVLLLGIWLARDILRSRRK